MAQELFEQNGHVANGSANGHVNGTKPSSPPANATVDGSSNPVKTPFIHPSPASSTAPPRTLTPEQEAKYASVLAAAQSWTEMPTTSAAKAPKEPLTETERMWLTRDCLLRYLRATKWKVPDAINRLQTTLVWRREYGVYKHTAEYMSEENETGKQVILGYDNDGRPCLYLNPQHQNTKGKDKQTQHLVFMLERCIDLMPPGQEKLSLLVNFKDTRKEEGQGVSQGRQVLGILQGHYPERLGRACVKNVPWLLYGFFKLITPFIDPVTKEKLKFDENLRTIVPPDQLIKAYDGDVEFVYDHATYWPALIGFAGERARQKMLRWEKAGKKVGESEDYLKGVGEPIGGFN